MRPVSIDTPALLGNCRSPCNCSRRREGWDRGRCQTGWDAESAWGPGSRRPPSEAQMRLLELPRRAPPHRGAAFASSIGMASDSAALLQWQTGEVAAHCAASRADQDTRTFGGEVRYRYAGTLFGHGDRFVAGFAPQVGRADFPSVTPSRYKTLCDQGYLMTRLTRGSLSVYSTTGKFCL
jgi:hypothetical protein